ncbi:hypothetical protein V8F06_012817 [Rhypophila decipiens]
MSRFITNLQLEISMADRVGGEWASFPDLYQPLSAWIFCAQVEALYGTSLSRLYPLLFEDFRAFYNAFPTLSSGRAPRWVFPAAYRAQDKMLDNFIAWKAWCQGSTDLRGPDLQDLDYDLIWGSQYIRRMVQRYEDLGFSERCIAATMLGCMFV